MAQSAKDAQLAAQAEQNRVASIGSAQLQTQLAAAHQANLLMREQFESNQQRELQEKVAALHAAERVRSADKLQAVADSQKTFEAQLELHKIKLDQEARAKVEEEKARLLANFNQAVSDAAQSRRTSRAGGKWACRNMETKR